MTDQHEKVLREFVQHATDIFNLSKEPVELIGTSREDIEALTALLDKREHNRRAEPAGLRELVGKNRGPVDSSLNDFERGYRHGLNRFADELEAALANTEPSVPVSRLEAAVKHIAFTHGENGSGGFSYIIWEDVEKLIAEARSHE